MEVINLDKALNCLGVTYAEVEHWLVKGVIDVTEPSRGDIYVTESQYRDLKTFLQARGVLKGELTVTLREIKDYCLQKGYVSTEQEFDRLATMGFFTKYRIEDPFNKGVEYPNRLLVDLNNAHARGSIKTLKSKGYTKQFILEDLKVTSNQFQILTKTLKVHPHTVDEEVIYSDKDYWTIKVQLSNMIKGSLEKVEPLTNGVIQYRGRRYVPVNQIENRVQIRRSTLQYLKNLDVLKVQNLSTYTQESLELVEEHLLKQVEDLHLKGFKPIEIALIVKGVVKPEECGEFVFEETLTTIMHRLGFEGKKMAKIKRLAIRPTYVINSMKVYTRGSILNMLKRQTRGTFLSKDLGVEYISTTKLSELTGLTTKNIRSYIVKNMDIEKHTARDRNVLCVNLDEYLSLQDDKETIMNSLDNEYRKLKDTIEGVFNQPKTNGTTNYNEGRLEKEETYV